jgi:hypothetical protein
MPFVSTIPRTCGAILHSKLRGRQYTARHRAMRSPVAGSPIPALPGAEDLKRDLDLLLRQGLVAESTSDGSSSASVSRKLSNGRQQGNGNVRTHASRGCPERATGSCTSRVEACAGRARAGTHQAGGRLPTHVDREDHISFLYKRPPPSPTNDCLTSKFSHTSMVLRITQTPAPLDTPLRDPRAWWRR